MQRNSKAPGGINYTSKCGTLKYNILKNMTWNEYEIKSGNEQVQSSNSVTLMRNKKLRFKVSYRKMLQWIQSQREAELGSDNNHINEIQVSPMQAQRWLNNVICPCGANQGNKECLLFSTLFL